MARKRVIKCLCSPPEHCKFNEKTDQVCKTNVGCYRSWVAEARSVIQNFGCFQNDSMHLLFSCKIRKNSKMEIKCCYDQDFCNEKLKLDNIILKLKETSISGGQKSVSSQDVSSESLPLTALVLNSQQATFSQHPDTKIVQRPVTNFSLLLNPERQLFFHIGTLGIISFLIAVFTLSSAFLYCILFKRKSFSNPKSADSNTLASPPFLQDKTNQLSNNQLFHTTLFLTHCIKKSPPRKNGNKCAQAHRIYTLPSYGQAPGTRAEDEKHSASTIAVRVNKPQWDRTKKTNGYTWKLGKKSTSRLNERSPSKCHPTPDIQAIQPFLQQTGGTTTQGDIRNQAPCIATGSSGSGSGVPFLVQRTIAWQIELKECIGCGRFGEVWRGIYEGEDVAVKIFCSRDEQSWLRETTIFTRLNLRHENLLSYLASDLTSRNGCTQLWMITQYHAAGSLYDYLQTNTFPISTGLLLATSSAKGLCYLHSVITGVHGKPAIAHRDIKSKNILVQANGTCCIADLGLAEVQHRPNEPAFFACPNYKVGTKRYMAPETLSILCNTNSESNDYASSSILTENQTGLENKQSYQPKLSFEVLKAGDVYAFSLVLWEILRRSTLLRSDDADAYMLPYGDLTESDPTFQTMYQIVCVDRLRPTFSRRWENNKIVDRCTRLMNECWNAQPEFRLTMLRVKKTLKELLLASQLNENCTVINTKQNGD